MQKCCKEALQLSLLITMLKMPRDRAMGSYLYDSGRDIQVIMTKASSRHAAEMATKDGGVQPQLVSDHASFLLLLEVLFIIRLSQDSSSTRHTHLRNRKQTMVSIYADRCRRQVFAV